MSLLTIGLSGLRTTRDALGVTSNNVANSNNPAYRKQLLKQASGLSQLASGGYVGQGVKSVELTRVTNDFLYNQVLKTGSQAAYSGTLANQLSRIDDLFAQGSNGLSEAMTQFNNAAEDLTLRPTDLPARQNYLGQAAFLVDQFNTVGNRLESIRQDNNTQIALKIDEINSLTSNLARLNKSISQEVAAGNGGNLPLNLLDQRDDLVLQLSEKVDVQILEGARGELNVFMRNGQSLVSGERAFNLVAVSDAQDPENLTIARDPGEGQGELIRFATKNLGRGELSGLLEFRDGALSQYQNTLGLMAVRFAEQVNTLQTQGLDLDDNLGQNLFSFASSVSDPNDNGISKVVGNAFNSNAIAAQVTNLESATLSTPEFELFGVDNGAGGVEVRYRALGSKGAGIAVTDLGGGQLQVPGAFTLSITSGVVNIGDSLQVQTTVNAAQNLRLNQLTAEQVATRAAFDASGAPIAPTELNRGDASQIRKVTGVLSQPSMYVRPNGQGISIQNAFSRFLTVVGNDVSAAKDSQQASNNVLDKLSAEQSAVSGVNLDEEAAALIQFQQAYNANAKIISLSKELFEDFLSAIR